MSFRDDMTHVASAAEMTSRDEREASLLNDYDAPDEMPPSAIYAKRSVGTTTPMIPLDRLAALAQTAEYGAELPTAPADPNDSLAVALRASVMLTNLEQRIARCEKQLDRIANFVQGLPQRTEHEAVIADIEGLRDQLRGLSLRKAS